MSFKKRFIPTIYLKDGKAYVTADCAEVLYESAVEAAEVFSNNGAIATNPSFPFVAAI